jgi:hypothetical protein
VFVAPPEISSSFDYSACDNTVILANIDKAVCVHYSFVTVDVVPIVPPYGYSNLCSSVILTSYIPVYIYIYIIGILQNVIWTYVNCTYVTYSKCPTSIQFFLMGVMWPNHDWCSAESKLFPLPLSRRLLRVDNILCDILHHNGILLTFGLCCPVLAIAIAVYVTIYVLVLLVVLGRFVKLVDSGQSDMMTIESTNYKTVLEALEKASSDSDMYVRTCMWEVVWMSSIFYAFLCWDMASDRTYWKNVLWLPVTGMMLPLAMWLCYNMLSKYCIRASTQNIDIENKQSYSEDASDRLLLPRVVSSHQKFSEVEFPRLTYAQRATPNGSVLLADINDDMVHNECEHHSEVISPLA